MDITTYHSSSKGNLYRIDDGNTRLLIEAGLPAKKIKEALDFRLDEIAACLITHSHKDHCKGAKGLMKCGIDCYMTEGTASALDITGHRAHIIKAKKQFQIGTWSILPFETIHDANESVGFLLNSGREKLLFCTDSQYVPYRFRGLTHVMIEVNYDIDILKENVRQSIVNIELAKKTIQGHMNLETAKGFFRMTDMSQVQEIHLLHLSDTNSNAGLFRMEIQQITGRPVYIAGG